MDDSWLAGWLAKLDGMPAFLLPPFPLGIIGVRREGSFQDSSILAELVFFRAVHCISWIVSEEGVSFVS